MSTFKKVMMNSWTISIIAPLIPLVLMKTVDLVAGTEILLWSFNAIASIVVPIYNFLIAKYEWRLYQLILLFISAPIIGMLILWIISKFQKVEEELQPEWFRYTKDTFNNVVYKWEWWRGADGKYQVSQISQHCSKCECHLINSKCPNCNSYFYRDVKPDNEIEVLILHRADIMEKNNAHTYNK